MIRKLNILHIFKRQFKKFLFKENKDKKKKDLSEKGKTNNIIKKSGNYPFIN